MRLTTFANCGNYVAILSCIASGARDKSEILVLDVFKNILNKNKHALKKYDVNVWQYLACKFFINESYQEQDYSDFQAVTSKLPLDLL